MVVLGKGCGVYTNGGANHVCRHPCHTSLLSFYAEKATLVSSVGGAEPIAVGRSLDTQGASRFCHTRSAC